jgi:hypothetical protein
MLVGELRQNVFAVRTSAILLILFVMSSPLKGQVTESTDPALIERRNRTLTDLAVRPVDLRFARIEDLLCIPGIGDSLALGLLRGTIAIPSHLRPYLRISSSREMTWSSRRVQYGWAGSDNGHTAISSRLRVSSGRSWSGGLVVERDVGERSSVDHTGGTLSWRSDDARKTVVAGNMRAHIGTGLLVSRYSRSWVGLNTFRPKRAGVSPTLATLESGELTGVGTSVGIGRLSLLVVTAWPRWDAALSDSGDYVERIYTDGTHVTEGQQERKDRLSEQYLVSRLGWNPTDELSLGVSGSHSRYSIPVDLTANGPGPRTFQIFTGVDGRFQSHVIDLRGEVVRDINGPGGGTFAVDHVTGMSRLTVAGWYYGPSFRVPHGLGWSYRDISSDERALLVGGRTRWKRKSELSWSVSAYRQDRASSTDPAQRDGYREEVRLKYPLSLLVDGNLRLRHRWTRVEGDTPERRSEFRMQTQTNAGKLRMVLRVEGTHVEEGNGGLVGCGVKIPDWRHWRIDALTGVFDASVTGAGIYVYEPRAHAYGVVRQLTGTGAFGFAKIVYEHALFVGSLATSAVVRRGRQTDVRVTIEVSLRTPRDR